MCDFTSVHPKKKEWQFRVGVKLNLYVTKVGFLAGTNGLCKQYDPSDFQIDNLEYTTANIPFGPNPPKTGTIDTLRFFVNKDTGYWNLKATVDGVTKTAKKISCSKPRSRVLLYTGTYEDGTELKIYQKRSNTALWFDNINLKAVGVDGAPSDLSIYFRRMHPDPDFFSAEDELLLADDYAIIPHHHDELGDHVVQLRLESEFGYAVLKNPDPATLQMLIHAFSFNQPVYFSMKESVYHPTIQLIKIGEGSHK